ncbi:MAG: type II secretion system protein [Rubrivivax sp.]|nr:type II secretion system protein [Rubrivivax sp.]
MNTTSHAALRGAGRHARRGFSLVEMVLCIALIGTLAVVAAPLLRLPLAAWVDASRRAELLQSADAVNTRLAQDLQRALPGSVRLRTVGARVWLEMLEVRAEGRYRSGAGGGGVCPVACAAPASRDALQTGCTDTCFTSLGALEGDAPMAADWVVVMGAAGANPYLGGNVAVPGGVKTRLVDATAAPEGRRVRHAAHNFLVGSPTARFYVVSAPISWECDPGAGTGTGTLRRVAGYAVAAVQPTAFAGATSNVLVHDGVAACRIVLAPGNSGSATVQLRLQLQRSSPGGLEVERFDLTAQYAVPPWR